MFELIWKEESSGKIHVNQFENSSILLLQSCVRAFLGANTEFRLWYIPDDKREEGQSFD